MTNVVMSPDVVTSPDVYTAVVTGAITLLGNLITSERFGLACVLLWFIWLLRNKLTAHIDRMEENRPIREPRFAHNYDTPEQAIEDLARGDGILREHGLDVIIDSLDFSHFDVLNAISGFIF